MNTEVSPNETPSKKPGLLRRLYNWTIGCPRRLYNWTISWADRPGGAWALFFLALLESSFFPIPPDVLLLALCVGAPKKSFRFALICSAGSVVGGMVGYWIGMSAWHVVQGWFIPYVFSQEVFEVVKGYYQGNAFLAILVAAFTPIPYKVFTVAAGVFDVNFLTFLTASTIGRSARFFLVGGVIYFFGAKVKTLVEKYFDVFAWILLVLGIAGFVTVKFLR
ncbi:MAG: DedA family protein [Verrucomicrobia bacterium]|nr:DedA family protein [Verrucomicrobiota bacterium]